MTEKSALLDLPNLERFIRTITHRAGLRPHFKEGVKGPYTDTRGNIYLPPLKYYTSQKANWKIRAHVLHECLHHIKGPEVFDILQENKLDASKSPLGAIMNIVEDYRIEREGVKDYRGDAHVLREHWTDFTKGITEALKKSGKDADPRMGAMLKAVMENRADWESNPYARDFYKVCPPEMDEKFEQIKSAGYVQEMQELQTGKDSWDLSKKLYEMLFEKSAEEEIQRCKDQAEQDGDGEPQDGEGKGKPKPGKAKKGAGDGEEVDGISDLQIYMPSDDMTETDHECGPQGDQHVDYSSYDKGSGYRPYDPCPLEDMQVTWFRKGETVSGSRGHGERLRLPGNASPGFITRIKRELQIKSASQYIPNQKKGKLHAGSLWKVPMPQVGSGEWNRQVFRKRIDSDILDCAVLVVTDWSGSMGGEKCNHAAMSASLLNDAMSRGLHIPTMVIAFSENGHAKTTIGVVKEFDEQVNQEKIVDRFRDCFGFMANNADGDAIMWAYSQLARRKEKKKVLIVLSDGSPAGGRPGDLPAYTKRVIGDIEKSKHVDIYGIGIMDDNVKRFYKRNRVIHSADQLENSVVEVVRERILA